MNLIFRESKTIVTLNCQSRRDIVSAEGHSREPVVSPIHVACLLLALQARAPNLIYSWSTAETQASFQARLGPDSFQRPVNERLAMLRRHQKTEIYSLSMIDGQRTLRFSDEGKNFEILPSLGLGQRLTKTKAYVRGIEREWRTQPTPGAFSTPESVYEISLDGSNKFHRLFEIKPNLSSVVVHPAGTENFFKSEDNGKSVIYIHDVASGSLLHTWNLNGLLKANFPGLSCTIARLDGRGKPPLL